MTGYAIKAFFVKELEFVRCLKNKNGGFNNV